MTHAHSLWAALPLRWAPWQRGIYTIPALTALHEGDEDETRDGRYIFPLIGTLSEAAQSAAEAIDDDLENELTDAIDNFNASPGAPAALVGIDAAEDLQDLLDDLNDQDIFFDTYTGLSISEPGDRQGGAFFAGFRLVGSGIAAIADDDVVLLDDYIDALQFISSGGTQGTENPQLFDPDSGALLNPNDNFTSSARAQALLISEIAVSVSRQIDLWGEPFAIGVAPKVLALTLFEGEWEASDGDFDSVDDDEAELQFNADIGAVATFDEVWRVGLSVKDIFPKTINTSLGNTFELKPRARLGLAYVGERFQLGLDADLSANPIANSELTRRDVSLGAEFTIAKGWSLRAGYQQDLENFAGSATSFGFSVKLTRFIMDAAIINGDTQTGGALQFSWLQ